MNEAATTTGPVVAAPAQLGKELAEAKENLVSTEVALAFHKCHEAEFEAIRREIEALIGDLEPTKAARRRNSHMHAPSFGIAP